MDSRIDIGWGTFWKILLVAIVALSVYYSINILAGVFLAIIISSSLNPFVTWLNEKISVPRVLGTVIVFLIIALFIASIVYAITPTVVDEINRLLEGYFPYIGQALNIDILKSSDIFSLSIEKIYTLIPKLYSGGIVEFSQSILGSATLFLSVLAMSFYLTVDHQGIERFLRAILPFRHEAAVVDVFLRARRKMGYWLQAQILLSFFVGLLTFLGLLILGVPHALILGILAAILEIIPFVGPVFTAALAFAVALTLSLQLAIYVLILFLVIQQVEGNILLPLFMKRAVGLHPVAVLIALLLGANFFGFVGLILAVPATVIVEEFLSDFERKKAHRQTLV